MSQGFKHSTKWSFEQIVWHRVTKTKGMIFGICLYMKHVEYIVVFENDLQDKRLAEIELTDVEPTIELDTK